MKKAQSEPTGGLTTAVKLLLVLITIGLMILIIYSTGLISEANTIFCVYLTRMSSHVRGMIVAGVLGSISVITALFTGAMVTSRFCKGTAVASAVACGVLIAMASAFIYSFATSFAGTLPLFSCAVPPRTVGTQFRPVSEELFAKTLAESTLDCYYMYAAGEYNPLYGKTPPNPRNCNIISFNLKEQTSIKDLVDFMKDEHVAFKGGSTYRFVSTHTWGISSSVDYGVPEEYSHTFSVEYRDIVYNNEKWRLSVLYHVWGDICGDVIDRQGIDVCLTHETELDNYPFNLKNNKTMCTCNVNFGAPKSIDVNNVDIYVKSFDFGEKTDIDPEQPPNTDEGYYWWNTELYVGQHTVDSYMSRINNALNYRICVEGLDECINYTEISTRPEDFIMQKGQVVIAYKDYSDYWFETVSGSTDVQYGNYECGIPPLTEENNFDEVFWCFLDVDMPSCENPNMNVCLAHPGGDEVSFGPHGYIGFCKETDGDLYIENIKSCTEDYCFEDPATGECKKECSCWQGVEGNPGAGCYKKIDTNDYELCELIISE